METMPVGDGLDTQSWFMNCIAAGQYDGYPQELLDSCKSIETALGREPDSHNQPRTADVDILLFDDLILNKPDLIIPHPRMCERRFCLEGLLSLKPDLIVPGTGTSVRAFYLAMPSHMSAQTINFIQ